MSKVLYLDFDGVLHPASGNIDTRFSKAPLLAQALDGNACDIVISSSWRFQCSKAELRKLLPDGLAERVVGCTGSAIIGRFAREREILAHVRGWYERIDWMALDDCEWDFSDHSKLIHCNPNTGFDEDGARLLRLWLQS